MTAQRLAVALVAFGLVLVAVGTACWEPVGLIVVGAAYAAAGLLLVNVDERTPR